MPFKRQLPPLTPVSEVEFRSVLINGDEHSSAVLLTWARANAELPMCETCNELDKRIEHYQKIAFSLNDQLTVERSKALIAKLEAQKKALHPEQQ
ncbi:hypothetical protein [Bradyrhizobium sp. S3.9.1]|uniref:hypothetical protein n=1 Tax=Bradyrhizobium sp. S3.9.1 TaxID=3156431 RepID=UPI00339929B4